MTNFASVMKLSGITSRRRVKHRPSWNLVFEWEEILSESLSVPLRCPGRIGWTLRSLFRRFGLPFAHRGDPTLEFVMVAKPDNQGRYGRNSIPWIIDYFLSDDDTRRFLATTSRCPLVFVSSREAYEKLLACGTDPQRFRHVPLSLPDRYRLDSSVPMTKDIDIALVGRVSEVLDGYARRYAAEHPGVVMAVRGPRRKGHLWAYDIKGTPVADIESHDSYMALLRRSRVFLYSTPGMDDGKPTNGFSQVTPRFLEAVASGCTPVMRYFDNADSRFYGLAGFSPSVGSYEEFAAHVSGILASPVDLKAMESYLAPHYTSSVARDVAACLAEA
ncbi:hypothetical protein [uncultured Duncaniella sp.]|uniref:hypothetical protein n=2 Tax=uncultured Duncaniella sp. TaxID=2768039 RepID=UPI0027311140|nr:hypothetical protein [uncultured Duncaniella sp.]